MKAWILNDSWIHKEDRKNENLQILWVLMDFSNWQPDVEKLKIYRSCEFWLIFQIGNQMVYYCEILTGVKKKIP